MSTKKELVESYFSKLGLDNEIARIYLALYNFGPQTISELSRTSEVERTRIYRLLNKLLDSCLVEVEKHYKKGVYKAAPVSNLKILLSRQEQNIKSLNNELEMLEQALSQNVLTSPTSKVQFYQGAQGNKQMLWNETRAKTEILSILHENMQVNTKGVFFERWVSRCNERGLKFRGIISDDFIASQQRWYATKNNEKLKNWHQHYVATDIYPITFSSVIYDDVVAYYNWKDGDIFGIEIHNKDIAAAQRRFFEMLWEKSTFLNS